MASIRAARPTTSGNFTLIKDVFRPELVERDARLVLLRHVLEHIEQPVPLLASLPRRRRARRCSWKFRIVNWIFANGTFWDFCYEHCNYFTPGSLAYALTQAGYEVQEQLLAFLRSVSRRHRHARRDSWPDLAVSGASAIEIASAYALTESVRMRAAQAQVERAGSGAVLWGMATKGVVFATLLPRVAGRRR